VPLTLRGHAAGQEVLTALGDALRDAGDSPGRLFLVDAPRLHARSTIYLVGAADAAGCARRWVVKRPVEGAGQEDLAHPMSAGQQFEVLRLLASHFRVTAPVLRVPRPVALLSSLGAFVMEFAEGAGVDSLARPGRLVEPTPLFEGIALSASFLRHLHAIEPPGETLIHPRGLALDVLTLAEETMRPAGLVLPAEVTEALEGLQATEVWVPTFRLHGDFAPVNMIVEAGRYLTGIDVSLTDVGIPEDDLARFVMMLATERLFLAGSSVARTCALRRRAEGVLLEGYYGEDSTSMLLELRVIQQLCLRWLRRTTARVATRPLLAGARKRLVDAYFVMLLRERARALADAPPLPASRAEVGIVGECAVPVQRRL
jgi:aminoglycoside phosphotransferase (APT) family kinase protein